MYLMSVVNMAENKRDLLIQPYLNQSKTKQDKIQKLTQDEALNYIFEGVQ